MSATAVAVLLPARRRRWHAAILEHLRAERSCTLREIDELAQAPDADFIFDLRPDAAPHDDPRIVRFCFGESPALPFAAEIAAGANAVAVRMECGAVTVREGRFPVERTYARTWSGAAAHLTEWPAWFVRALRDGRCMPYRAPLVETRALTPLLLARFAVRQCALFVRGWISRLFVDHAWDVGLAGLRAEEVVRGDAAGPVRWLHPHLERPFFADPFPRSGAQGVQLLCEQLSADDRLGRITELHVDESTGACEERDFIGGDGTHYSYPSFVEYQGATYCVPENAESGGVRAFPVYGSAAGAPVTLLEGVPACDSTIVQYGDRWWLFCTRRDRGANLALYLYHAPSPLGPWNEHPSNPVKIDVAGARPAGPVFAVGSQLYRPAQDCSAGYGGAVVVHRILRLDVEAFCEEAVARIEPFDAAYPHGTHTLCFLPDGRAVVDGKREFFSIAKPFSILRGRAARKRPGLRDAIPANRLRQAALAFPLRWTHRRPWRAPKTMRRCSEPYYVDWSSGCGTFGEDWDVMPRDAAGVLLTLRGALYHPIDIAQFALHSHAQWKDRGDRRARSAFLAQAAWLRDNQVSLAGIDGLYPFPFPWPKYGAGAGWLSAMAQGEAISVLLRAEAEEPGYGFGQAAQQAAQAFRYTLEEGGVVFRSDGECFLEECAVEPAPHILNGCIFALWGLWELQSVYPQPWCEQLVRDVVFTLRRWLPLFDNGWWTRYSLQRSVRVRDHLATLKYHAFHIAQMRVLGAMTSEREFVDAAERWEGYVARPESRVRLLIETALSLPARFADA